MWILVYIFFIILNAIAYFVPKNIKKSEIYSTSIFAILFGFITDEVLNLHLNLYGYFNHGFQWQGFFSSFMYFIPINNLFLNYFPVKKGPLIKAKYIVIWTLFSVLFEWLILQTEYLYYNGWKLWYSALLYPFIFLILYINLIVVRKLNNSEKC
ncbi:putative neutral ceramidase superfamily lipid hydrolase [Peribacillus deserti]|uniref:Neutral ceramidase superfamily lipid hydrolase n=1 Tax=Peribacillus deserti TaxID=673318 RepID=A0ABS2QNN5_9BACI|nr:putative neutral ceramidase superfamily lipid hydrolase [Peribacillus deserti]